MGIIDDIKKTGISVADLSKATGIPAQRIYKWCTLSESTGQLLLEVGVALSA